MLLPVGNPSMMIRSYFEPNYDQVLTNSTYTYREEVIDYANI